MLGIWEIAGDGWGLIVRNDFRRLVVSATTEAPGQRGDDANAGGNSRLDVSTEGEFDDGTADMEAMA